MRFDRFRHFAGTVQIRIVLSQDPVATAASNNPLLTTLVSLDPIHLFFNVSEADGMTYKRLVQKGEIPSARDNKVEVEGELIDESNWPLKGTIDFVDNQYDRSTGTIRVRAVPRCCIRDTTSWPT